MQTLPLYAQGPKHHVKGPLIGYVEREVCVEYKPLDPKEFIWPKPVY